MHRHSSKQELSCLVLACLAERASLGVLAGVLQALVWSLPCALITVLLHSFWDTEKGEANREMEGITTMLGQAEGKKAVVHVAQGGWDVNVFFCQLMLKKKKQH